MRRTTASILLCVFLLSLAAPLNEAEENGKMGNTDCGQCHGTVGSVTFTLTGYPTEYTPGTTYGLTLELTSSLSGAKGGFSFIVSKGIFQNTGAGVLVNVNQATHSNSNNRIWSFDWVAPNQGSGLITFDAYGVTANGNSQNTGDIWDSETWFSMETPPLNNEPPTVSNVILSPSGATSADDLTVTYDYNDPDGDPESGTIIEWYKNSSQEVSLSGTMVASSSTSKAEVWFARVIPSDGVDPGEPTDSNSLTILNGAPSIASASITPNEPTTDQVLSLSYTPADPDSDPTTITGIRWFVDGVKVDSLDDENEVPVIATRVDDIWHAQIMISDGELTSAWFTTDSVIIDGTNTAPLVNSVIIDPTSPSTTDDLDCDWVFFDADSDPITNWQIRWQIDEVISQNHDGQEVISSDQTSKGQSWKAGVKAFDGTEWSQELWSSAVIIGNTPPVINTLSLLPTLPQITDSINYNYSFSDLDNDSIIQIEETWYVDEVVVSNINPLPAGFELSDVIRLELRINDGSDWSAVVSAQITLQNTLPVVNLNSTTVEPDSLSDLNITIETSDIDGHNVETTIIWTKNGYSVAGLNDSLSVSAALLAPGATWMVTVTPDDGIGQGEAVTMSFTIGNIPPVAMISAEEGSNYVGLAIALSAMGSSDIDGIVVDAIWQIEGQTYSGLEINFIPTLTSNQVTLTVYDDQGASNNVSTTVNAIIPPMPSEVIAVQEGSGIRLTWQGTATQYQILRDGQQIALVDETTYFDQPTLGGDHSYQVNTVIDGDVIGSGPTQSANIDASAITIEDSSDNLASLIMAIFMLIIGGLGIAASFIGRGD
jgi:hypothetical protein